MKLYNSLTNKKEEFRPSEEGKVSIYACGPTVYNDMHVGNVRPQVVFDVLRRFFIYLGYDVKYVSNFTDVDDKIINKANEENTTIDVISKRYIKSVEDDLKALHVYDYPIIHPTCTEHMDDIIEFIDGLIKKGFAYESNGDVYFRVRKLKDYGKLSNRNIEDLEVGARIEKNEIKEDPLDFTLWKKKKEGEVYWDSPWSEGRPGWHIECSTMIKSIFGGTIDIHCGGEDLKFPHHENEIAQSEALMDKPLAHYWLHNGMINIENVKMSKSLGNFLYAKDFLEKESGEVLRFFILNAHYRKPLNFNTEAIEAAKTSLRRLKNSKKRLTELLENAEDKPANDEISKKIGEIRESFKAHMGDDLNTPDAFSDMFALSKFANSALDENSSKGSIEEALKLFGEFTEVLGILQEDEESGIDSEVKELIQKRDEARKNKDYKLSDEIRDRLTEMGYIVKDTPNGTEVEKK